MSDFVLNEWNGRPVLFFSETDWRETLNWLLWGHSESFEIWMKISMGTDDAQQIVDQHEASDLFDLGNYLREHFSGKSAEIESDFGKNIGFTLDPQPTISEQVLSALYERFPKNEKIPHLLKF